MNLIINFLHVLGFTNITSESDIVVLYAGSIFFLSFFVLICFVNLTIYFLIVTYLNEETLNKPQIKKLFEQMPILRRIIILYRNTRIIFIIFEIVMFFILMYGLLVSSYNILSSV